MFCTWAELVTPQASNAPEVSPGASEPLGSRRTSTAWASRAKPCEPASSPLRAQPVQPVSAQCTRYQMSYCEAAAPVSLMHTASSARPWPVVPQDPALQPCQPVPATWPRSSTEPEPAWEPRDTLSDSMRRPRPVVPATEPSPTAAIQPMFCTWAEIETRLLLSIYGASFEDSVSEEGKSPLFTNSI